MFMAFPLAALVLISISPVADAAPKAKVVVATGSIRCARVTGSITYNPPVRHVGTQPETQVFRFRASACSTTNSNVKRVTGGNLTVTVHRTTNSCVDLLATHLSTSTGTWTPTSIHTTSATFSGYVFVHNAAGDIGFTVPNPGAVARVSGSFAGKDHGRSSTATTFVSMTAAQLASACLSPAGLSKQSIVSGYATFG